MGDLSSRYVPHKIPSQISGYCNQMLERDVLHRVLALNGYLNDPVYNISSGHKRKFDPYAINPLTRAHFPALFYFSFNALFPPDSSHWLASTSTSNPPLSLSLAIINHSHGNLSKDNRDNPSASRSFCATMISSSIP